MHSRQEILEANFKDYQKVSKKGRKELLDRLVSVTGFNRNYLATALGNYGMKGDLEKPPAKGRRKPRPSGKWGGRPVKYGEGFAKVLTRIWDEYGNSMVFINEPLFSWCIGRHIEATRNRSYHKNDNCYAEQKNYTEINFQIIYHGRHELSL